MTTSRRFLVLHGWENHRPREHWQWWLTESLRSDGEQVLYPQLPDADDPSLEAWTRLLRAELAQLGSGERVVVAHSLGCALWMHAAPLLDASEHVDRVLLVAPASPAVLARHREVAEFAGAAPDGAVSAGSTVRTARALATVAGSTRLVCSDDDPYCPEGADTVYGPLGLDTDVLPGQAHLNPDSGYGPWPSVLAWCRDPQVRLVAR